MKSLINLQLSESDLMDTFLYEEMMDEHIEETVQEAIEIKRFVSIKKEKHHEKVTD